MKWIEVNCDGWNQSWKKLKGLVSDVLVDRFLWHQTNVNSLQIIQTSNSLIFIDSNLLNTLQQNNQVNSLLKGWLAHHPKLTNTSNHINWTSSSTIRGWSRRPSSTPPTLLVTRPTPTRAAECTWATLKWWFFIVSSSNRPQMTRLWSLTEARLGSVRRRSTINTPHLFDDRHYQHCELIPLISVQ